MITKDAGVELHREIDTFQWVGAVTDDVPQADDLGNALVGDIGKHRLEGFQVAVNITQDRPFHVTTLLCLNGPSAGGCLACRPARGF